MGQRPAQPVPLSLIILDIDFFKQYNDHYGHIKGDECFARWRVPCRWQPTGHGISSRGSAVKSLYGYYRKPTRRRPKQVARRCLHLICQQQIEHGFRAVSNLLTMSLGVGTRIVTPDQSDAGICRGCR